MFRAALEHYVHGFVRQRITAFAGADAGLEELEQLFVSVLEPPLSDGYGCLVNNSIIEFGNAPGIASDGINETLALVREGIASVLAREIGAAAAELEAMQLVLLYHGVLTLSRSGTSLEAMRSAVGATFDRLRVARSRHNNKQ